MHANHTRTQTQTRTHAHTRTAFILAAAISPLLALNACDQSTQDPVASGASETSSGPAAPTNRVDIPASVRQNLGITFANVERRNVARTLRIPGRFELLPTARREYRAAAAGTIELLVTQYQMVEAGTPLYRLDAPRWREMQRELADAEASVKMARAGVDSIAPLLAAHENHHVEIQKAVDLWSARVATLDELRAAGGATGDEIALAKASLASSRSEFAETLEKEAELQARATQTAANLDAATARLEFLYEAAATLAGVPVDALRGPSTSDVNVPRWREINAIDVAALTPGVVDIVGVASGGMIDQHAAVLSTVQPELVRFRAVALQSDLYRLADGQTARVVPAQSIAPAPNDAGDSHFEGTLTLAPTANPERRTLEVVLQPTSGTAAPAWAKAGVSAFLEVMTSASPNGASATRDDPLAIPLKCVTRDGTKAIIFRRDPANPDKAIRMEADLGIDDGRWVVIKSGVGEGNQIVLDGVYQLMVATSGTITKGGHFHPDGTFHEGED